MSRAHYKSDNGLVHAQYPLNTEITLCGDAPEGAAWTFDDGKDPNAFDANKPVKGPVTCLECARMILGVKGYRIHESTKRSVNEF